jgi:hypothetical protein
VVFQDPKIVRSGETENDIRAGADMRTHQRAGRAGWARMLLDDIERI